MIGMVMDLLWIGCKVKLTNRLFYSFLLKNIVVWNRMMMIIIIVMLFAVVSRDIETRSEGGRAIDAQEGDAHENKRDNGAESIGYRTNNIPSHSSAEKLFLATNLQNKKILNSCQFVTLSSADLAFL
jgi:hypothetical protein